MPPVGSVALRYTESESYTEALAWLDSPELLKGTVERVREVRALGMDVGVDFHGRVHKGMARQLAKLLEGEGVLFIEGEKHPHVWSVRTSTEFDSEPLLPTQPSEFADLGRLVSTPIAAGERLYSRHEFRPYFEGHALDVAQPDVSTHLSAELQSPFSCRVFAYLLMFQPADNTDKVSNCGGI